MTSMLAQDGSTQSIMLYPPCFHALSAMISNLSGLEPMDLFPALGPSLLALMSLASYALAARLWGRTTGVAAAFLSVFFQAEACIRDIGVTGVQTCALPISPTAVRAAPTSRGEASGPSAWAVPVVPNKSAARRTRTRGTASLWRGRPAALSAGSGQRTGRSGERRVGKECRSRWARYH